MNAEALPIERSRRAGALPAVIVFLVAIAMLLPGLGDAPLAGTEGHRALSAHQMVESGQWLVPELYGRTYLRKPPLHYWAIAGAESIGGPGEFVWRLPTVLEYALLAMLLTWAGGRLFGTSGAWASGIGLLAIVPLWAQARTADIDTLNNLTATASAIAIIFLTRERRWVWALVGGIALGACWMTKGPAGLPIVLGATVAALIVSRGERRSLSARLGALWGIGLLIFGVYCVAVVLWFRSRGLPLDLSGVQEGAGNARPDNLARFLLAFLVPAQLLAFALPTSIALLIVSRPAVRRLMESHGARATALIVLSVLIAWGVQLLSGMHNARYGYPTLPLLALLAGAVMSQLHRYTPAQRRQLALILLIVIAVWFLATAGLAAKAYFAKVATLPMIGVAGLSLVLTAWACFAPRRRAIAMLVLVPLAAIPFAFVSNASRVQRSGIHAAQTLREVVGPGNPCVVGAMLRYKPELFWYSGVAGKAYREDVLRPEELTESTWLLLMEDEYHTLYAPVAPQLKTVVPIKADDKAAYIVYYEKAVESGEWRGTERNRSSLLSTLPFSLSTDPIKTPEPPQVGRDLGPSRVGKP